MMNRTCKHIIYTAIQFSWGLFQNILGAGLLGIMLILHPKRKPHLYHGAVVTDWKMPGSMGLGMFIFFGHGDQSPEYAAQVMVHEFGHTIQSCILGPLFLPVIGLPSLLWASIPLFKRWRREGKFSYMDFYPEKWANHEGERVLRKP